MHYVSQSISILFEQVLIFFVAYLGYLYILKYFKICLHLNGVVFHLALSFNFIWSSV